MNHMPIGPSMPCACLDCVRGDVFVICEWPESTWPMAKMVKQRLFRREVWHDNAEGAQRTWFEWVPYDFKRSAA